VTPHPAPSGDLLTIGDAIVKGVLASLEPLRFEATSDDRGHEAAFRLRYRAVVERNLADAAGFPDGLERDEFDSSAIQVVGWDGDRPVATCRLVLPMAGRSLPVEQDFGVEVPAADRTVEVGRMVVEREYRSPDHRMFMGLASCGWLCMRERGLTEVVAATPARLASMFVTLGFAVRALGPPRMYWGEERVPIHCDGLATIPRIRELWTLRR
jgi:N-acyl-L-homoserine lactone synthetase